VLHLAGGAYLPGEGAVNLARHIGCQARVRCLQRGPTQQVRVWPTGQSITRQLGQDAIMALHATGNGPLLFVGSTQPRGARGRAYLNRITQLHLGVGTSKHFIERWSTVEAWGPTFDIVPRSRPSKFLSVRPGGSTNLQRHRNMASVSGVATACHDAYSATNRESRHWRFLETSHEPSLIHCGRKSAHWQEGLCKAPPAARPHS
jgi:hypothetical protein